MTRKTMDFTVGLFTPTSNVTVTSKQGYVEYKFNSGYESVDIVKAAVGNFSKPLYETFYDGVTQQSKRDAIERINNQIESLKMEVEALEFIVRCIRKNKWVEVKQ